MVARKIPPAEQKSVGLALDRAVLPLIRSATVNGGAGTEYDKFIHALESHADGLLNGVRCGIDFRTAVWQVGGIVYTKVVGIMLVAGPPAHVE
jgi:hypothetical protein